MATVRLICWKPELAEERAEGLRALAYAVDAEPFGGPDSLRKMTAEPPDDFEGTLGPLPEGTTVRRGSKGSADVVVWFVRSRKSLEDGVLRMGRLARAGRLWIAWAKKTSGVESELTQAIVRKVGLASGLVDYKVCRIDETWAALCFSHRGGRH